MTEILHATARQAERVWIIPRTANNPGSVVGRSTHRLRSIKFRVLKGCQPDQMVAQRGRQKILGNEYFATQNQLQLLRQGTGYRPSPSARLRREQGKGIAFFLA